ncbi:Hemin import ATP-binding protein HmuV [Alloiococcus otitis]|uniref:ABC transporter domain-containing protein n=1 Tax=Alloiococcus otitis ATCC 51267 TaxID=883081 RepID=K9EQ45_9LACT|nr:ATP-binding cassette domain-containing protein [Alloiococcus otitis]EKU93042.1 hypothetical protein HMPREF9698_01238 [Alloiococcus otitis ATCC 51267]SUU80794.1 Hemin import ATP-binding protein HmuV [Alloiococcus otitis]
MVTIKDFWKREVKKIIAIKNISLHVEEGEILSLIEPNGAGKTSLIKVMTGILEPTSGPITWLLPILTAINSPVLLVQGNDSTAFLIWLVNINRPASGLVGYLWKKGLQQYASAN